MCSYYGMCSLSQYVVSTRVRAARNVSGFSLPPGSSQSDRLGVEKVLTQAFSMFSGELKGTYYPLGGLSKEQEDTLQSNGAVSTYVRVYVFAQHAHVEYDIHIHKICTCVYTHSSLIPNPYRMCSLIEV